MYPFHPCSTIAVIGCTGSGKTTWVHEFLKQSANMFFDEPPKNILYCYNVFQPLFQIIEEDVQNIEFVRGLPSDEKSASLTIYGNFYYTKSFLHRINFSYNFFKFTLFHIDA